jgi:N-acetylglucosaminyldiphosphoundecaprenol N-acetyl-beta-D-mannosaminyltransferase
MTVFPRRIRLCGVGIDDVNMNEAVAMVEYAIRLKSDAYAVTPNVDHVVKLQDDAEFRKLYDEADCVFADGMPLLWGAKFLGLPLKEKISGSDLFPELCRVSARKGYRLFFLGGREGAAAQAADILRKKYPGIDIAGVYSPPMGFEKDRAENEKIVRMIKEAKTDILFVGLGAPKQEKWVYCHRREYGAGISIGIGVTFEFTAGMVKRAPVWMQKAGLEWTWRLFMEPKRLWRRYLVEDTRFLSLLLREKFKNRPRFATPTGKPVRLEERA